jgi:hypothetical protein
MEVAMSAWTPEELDRIGRADELDLASMRRDGTLRDPVTVWVVRDGDDLYVRSMHGPAGRWFKGTKTRRRGHIRAGGVDKDVTFTGADPRGDVDVDDRIDAEYRHKYRRYGNNIIGSVVNSSARAATIRLVPR